MQDIQSTLSRLREYFILSLPERISKMQALLKAITRNDPESLDALHRAAHNLVGAAGTHRLIQISEAARNLERIAAEVQKSAKISDAGLQALHSSLAMLAEHAAHPIYEFVKPPEKLSTSDLIIVVEDDSDQALWVRTILEDGGFKVETFLDIASFRSALKTLPTPTAVIMDMEFSEGSYAGAHAIAELKSQSLKNVPVICLSARKDMATKLAAHRAGMARYLTKPVDHEVLLRTITESAALAPMKPYRVLVVDDSKSQLAVHSNMLRQAGMEVREESNPLNVHDVLADFAAEVLLLDMHMPQCSGAELASILHDDTLYGEIPIVFLSTETDVSHQIAALERGGEHFLIKPVNPAHLAAVISMHARRYRQFMEQAKVLRTTRYSQDRYRQAWDAHAIISAADAAGNILYANDKFCEISGYSRNELIGKNHRIVKSDKHTPKFYADMWFTISSGKIWRGEVCNQAKNGSNYWVESTIVPFADENGRPYQYISIRTDITAIKLAQLNLEKLNVELSASRDEAYRAN